AGGVTEGFLCAVAAAEIFLQQGIIRADGHVAAAGDITQGARRRAREVRPGQAGGAEFDGINFPAEEFAFLRREALRVGEDEQELERGDKLVRVGRADEEY